MLQLQTQKSISIMNFNLSDSTNTNYQSEMLRPTTEVHLCSKLALECHDSHKPMRLKYTTNELWPMSKGIGQVKLPSDLKSILYSL